MVGFTPRNSTGKRQSGVGSREAVHAYLGHLSDQTIEATLNELSIELGAALGQERIYVAFADRTWILDAGERRESSAGGPVLP